MADGLAETRAPDKRGELRAWCALAVSALAVAGVFALLLALSRTPGIQDVFPWPLGFFKKGLVIHVIFSFVVWFLAVFGALMHLAAERMAKCAPRFNSLGRWGCICVATGFVLLFVPAFLDRGEPSLNNYIPVIIDPLYYGGLVFLALGLALPAIRLLLNIPGRAAPFEPLFFGVTMGAVIYPVALAVFWLAFENLAGVAPSRAFNDDLFWGGGHILQFLNSALMLNAWYLLANLSLTGKGSGPPPGGNLFKITVGIYLLAVLPTPLFYVYLQPFSAEQRQIFTSLQYALGPSAAVLAAWIVARAWRGAAKGGLDRKDPAFLTLILSIVVFGIGGFMGLFADGADTRTPAHYHGVIAGVTLSFMGLFYRLFLPLLGAAIKRTRGLYVQIFLFGGGQLIASGGLFLAGSFGAPRKIAGAAQGLEGLSITGMALNGFGALLAVTGGVMFIVTSARALLNKPAREQT